MILFCRNFLCPNLSKSYIIMYFVFTLPRHLTISVLQACCAVTTEYGIVRTSTASLQIKISTAQVNFSNRNVIIF